MRSHLKVVVKRPEEDHLSVITLTMMTILMIKMIKISETYLQNIFNDPKLTTLKIEPILPCTEHQRYEDLMLQIYFYSDIKCLCFISSQIFSL